MKILQDSEVDEKGTHTLFNGSVCALKAVNSDEESEDDEKNIFKIAAIASDEVKDTDGDIILRDSLDISYLSSKGYINWNHGHELKDVLGYVNKAEILEGDRIDWVKSNVFPSVSESSSLYIEGSILKVGLSPNNMLVESILTAVPKKDAGKGLGVSIEGLFVRDEDSNIIKARILGVALTMMPANPRTLVSLMKSISSYNKADKDLTSNLPIEVMEDITYNLKSEKGIDDLALRILRLRPKWSLKMARSLVHQLYTGV
jgi:hypothetical protein